MKILLINNFHFLKGGSERVYFNTAELLKQNGHEVFFFSLFDERNVTNDSPGSFPKVIDFRTSSNINKVLGAFSFVYNTNTALKLNLLLSTLKPDIAHIHLFMGGLTGSILKVLKKHNVPAVHTAHDYRLICPAYLFLDGQNNICEKCITGSYINCAVNKCSDNSYVQSTMLSIDAYVRKMFIRPKNKIDNFIFVSKFAQQIHAKFNNEFRYKSEMLYNFTHFNSNFQPDYQRGEYLLFYGRLSREKGVETLIDSVKHTNINLKIVGDGPLLESLKLTKTSNIEFLGFKEGEELNSIIKASSYIVVPSEWYENNPMTIVEAFSFGKPVIGANIGGIPELIKATGFLFNHGDIQDLQVTISKAMNLNNKDYNQLSINAYTFAKDNFNPKVHYKKLINIYHKTIKTQ